MAYIFYTNRDEKQTQGTLHDPNNNYCLILHTISYTLQEVLYMNLIELEKKIVPEIIDILELRYNILRNILYNEPIGRRGLAVKLNMGERTIRTEVNILKEQGLITIETMGMYVTEEGKNLIDSLDDVVRELRGISELEKALKEILNVKNVIIVPGNADENELVLKDMGKTTSVYMRNLIKDNFIIGVTGGTTMARVAEEMPPGKVSENVQVIPARGGLGKDMETQSNSIAARIAKKLDANYKLLHVPDNIDQNTLNALLELQDIKEVIELLDKMNMLVFGIGRADVMAGRRHLSKEQIELLNRREAVGEAFGHYFDINGSEVWNTLTVGITLESFRKIPLVIGVAGGERKAEAIMAVSSLRKDMTIITDEAAANRIIKIVNKATK